MRTRPHLILLGAFVAIAMSYTALALFPTFQLMNVPARLNRIAYSDQQERGRDVYVREGCQYCHSQQARPEGFGADQARGWARRASLAGDYVFDRPVLAGTMRTGPDLHDLAGRTGNVDSLLTHLFMPRAFAAGSNMPSYRYLFEVRDRNRIQPSDSVVMLASVMLRQPGKVVVARKEALDLVAYLQTLRHDRPTPTPETISTAVTR